ncbi:MAG TPA: hypothetical protein VNQ90_17745 [Chthoniobacteraceae bacterium]|nr:hypothetical protein [Chthoniobacteraceae bacterium]
MLFFKGGSPPKPKEVEVELPPPPKPIPPPPPPTEYRPDIEQVTLDTRNREAKKRGIGATLLAGETGGTNANGKRTLLG